MEKFSSVNGPKNEKEEKNMNANLKAEAIYQLKNGQKSGIKETHMDNTALYIWYNNGVNTINDGCTITVQFELNGRFHSIDVR